MKNFLIKTLFFTMLFVFGITSVCFADVYVPTPVEQLSMLIAPISLILLIVLIILFISTKLLTKTTKNEENKKIYESVGKGTQYYILLFLTLLTGLFLYIFAIIPFMFVIVSVMFKFKDKNDEKAFLILKKYIKVFVVIMIGLYILEAILY